MQNTLIQRPKIQKIMEKDTAIKTLNEIKEHIIGIDLSDICGEETEIFAQNIDDISIKRLIQAIQCGLVYWDDEENILVQKLIQPVQSGQITATEFKYLKRLTINELDGINVNNQIKSFIKMMSLVTARPTQIIEQMNGQDAEIAMGCMSFFAK